MGKKTSLALMSFLAVFLVAVLFISSKEDRMVPDIVNGINLATGARCDLGTITPSYLHSTIAINLITVYDPTNPSTKLLLAGGFSAALNRMAALGGGFPQLHAASLAALVINIVQHGSSANGLQTLLANTRRACTVTAAPANYRGKPLLQTLIMPQLSIADVEVTLQPFGLKTTAGQVLKLGAMTFHFGAQPVQFAAVIHKILAAVAIKAQQSPSLVPALRGCFSIQPP